MGNTDSSFFEESSLDGEEYVAIVKDGVNKKTKFNTMLLSAKFKEAVAELLAPIIRDFKDFQEEINEKIDSIVIGGVALKQSLGNEVHYGVSQKVLTEVINDIVNKLQQITGEDSSGFTMSVVPDYYLGNTGTTVHLVATSNSAPFDYIKVYVNGELVREITESTQDYRTDFHIEGNVVVRVIASILGVEYTREKSITNSYPYIWIGAGMSYEDVVNLEHSKPFIPTEDNFYDVEVTEEGQKLYVVVPINGTYLPQVMHMSNFTIPAEAVTNENYSILESTNTYKVGTYQINVE